MFEKSLYTWHLFHHTAWLWYNIIPKHFKIWNRTGSSIREIWTNDMTGSYTCQYHHISQRFETGSCGKLYICLKRELSHDKAHASWCQPTSASLNSYKNTGWNDFIARSLLWSNVVECVSRSSADHFRTDLCSDFNGSRNSSTHHCSG